MDELLLSLSRVVALRSTAVCLTATPVAHLASVAWHGLPPGSQPPLAALLAFPFRGGKRAAAFQLLGWGLWGISALACAPALLHLGKHLPLVPHTHVDVLSGAAATCSFIGLLFLLKAMLVYERPDNKSRCGSPDEADGDGSSVSSHGDDMPPSSSLRRALLASQGGSAAWRSRPGQFIRRHGPAAAVLLMGLLLTITGVLLLLSVEHMPDLPSRLLYCCLSLVCLIIGASSTHGLGGYLQWGRPPPDAADLVTPAPPPYGRRRQRLLREGEDDSGGTADANGSAASLTSLATAAATAAPVSLQGCGISEEDVTHPHPRPGVPSPFSRAAAAARQVDAASSWAFFQPFAGGTVFVATQAVAWSLFAVSIVLLLALVKSLVKGVARGVRAWLLGTSALMMLTQLLLAVSVLTWRNSRRARSLVRPIIEASARSLRTLSVSLDISQPTTPGAEVPSPPLLTPAEQKAPEARAAAPATPSYAAKLAAVWREQGLRGLRAAAGTAIDRFAGLHLPIIIMYVPVQTFFTLWALTFAFCPTRWVLSGWLAALPLLYALSLVGEPQHSGARVWPRFRNWMSRHLEASLAWWIGDVTVVPDFPPGAPPHSPDQKYILGFHPHGLYPTGAGFLPMLRSFRRLLPGLEVITLTASVIYYLPAIKDLSLWLGFRQVGRRTFTRALRQGASVLVCPGGQAELVYAYASHTCQPSLGGKVRPGALFARRVPLPPPSAASPLDDSEGGATANGTTADLIPAPGSHANGKTATNCLTTAPAIHATANGHDDAPAAPVLLAGGTEPRNGEEGLRRRKQGVLANGSGSPAGPAPQLPAPSPSGAAAAAESEPGAVGELVIYAGHKGFVRLAIEQQAALIPVLAIGEVLQLRNLIHMPSMQKWTYKRLGFPVPWFMVGRWGLSPLPCRTPLVYVVGAPIQPPPLSPGGAPSQEDVDALHRAFYMALADMYERHAHRHPAFRNTPLTMLLDHVHP